MYTEYTPCKVVLEGYEVKSKEISREQNRNRLALQAELNAGAIPTLSFEVFKKTAEERKALKELKKASKA